MNKINIPTEFKLFGHTYIVKLDDRLLETENALAQLRFRENS